MILSIIVPAYNVGPYLAACLDSLLACRLTDCEIILSWRESRDDTRLVCETYRAQYACIRLIEQDGTGLSDARNCAMRVARGEYLLFIDGDDFVDSAALDRVIDALRSGAVKADVVMTDFYKMRHPAKQRVDMFQIGQDKERHWGMDFLPHILCRRQAFWMVWRFVYRRAFLQKHAIWFTDNILSEDVDFTANVFLAEPEILFWHNPFYVYNVGRGGSLMDRPTLRRLRDTVYVMADAAARFRDSSFPYAKAMEAQFQFEYILNTAVIFEIESKTREEAVALYRDWKTVLSKSADPLVRMMWIPFFVFGAGGVGRVLHLVKTTIHRMRRWRQSFNPLQGGCK